MGWGPGASARGLTPWTAGRVTVTLLPQTSYHRSKIVVTQPAENGVESVMEGSDRTAEGRVMEGHPPTAEESAMASADDQDLRVACFCEENCWRLLYKHLNRGDGSTTLTWDYFAVFISNEKRACPMFRQRASSDARDYVCWDYHVVVLRRPRDYGIGTERTTEVLDVDTRIGYPASLESYLAGSFPHASNPDVDAAYLPSFRAVPARDYLARFYSDRGHMVGVDGEWLAKPPGYGCIMAGAAAKEERYHKRGNVSNLDSYIDMMSNGGEGTTDKGKVYSLEGLRKEFIG